MGYAVSAMGLPQQFRSKSGRQFPGIPHLDAIGKDNNLYKSVIAVIPVSNCINDGFSNDWPGNLELNGCLRACCAGTHAAIDFTQNELHRLIDHFEQSSLIRLLGCNGLALFRSMEMEAVDLSAPRFSRHSTRLA